MSERLVITTDGKLIYCSTKENARKGNCVLYA